jgi:hypothetical protein
VRGGNGVDGAGRGADVSGVVGAIADGGVGLQFGTVRFESEDRREPFFDDLAFGPDSYAQ